MEIGEAEPAALVQTRRIINTREDRSYARPKQLSIVDFEL